MAKFRFRLQSVLEHKQRLEDLAQIELAQRQQQQQREEASLQRLDDAEVRAVQELERQRFTGRLDVDMLQLGMGFLDTLKAQIQRQQQIVVRAQQHAEAKRGELVGYLQERKAMEKLRQRQFDAFTGEQNRAEARDVDELVVMRHARRQLDAARIKPRDEHAAFRMSVPGAPLVQPAAGIE